MHKNQIIKIIIQKCHISIKYHNYDIMIIMIIRDQASPISQFLYQTAKLNEELTNHGLPKHFILSNLSRY